jgi:hypothetical protein
MCSNNNPIGKIKPVCFTVRVHSPVSIHACLLRRYLHVFESRSPRSTAVRPCFGWSASHAGGANAQDEEPEFTSQFQAQDCRFRASGENPYFVLKPGYQLVLEGEEDGETIRLDITVLEKTETIDIPDIAKVRTRVVKEVETTDGELTESSPLEPDAGSEKRYCPGIGLTMDDVLQLVEYGFVEDDDNDQ